jgi:serine/threonine protein phosphatase PrpC
MNPSNRQTMEDESRAVDCFNGDKSQGFFAVYDGHGGGRQFKLYHYYVLDFF